MTVNVRYGSYAAFHYFHLTVRFQYKADIRFDFVLMSAIQRKRTFIQVADSCNRPRYNEIYEIT